MPWLERLADQELLRALSGLVVVVDDAVVGGLEAVEFLGFAAVGEAGEHHVGLGVRSGLVLAGIEHVEAVARRALAWKSTSYE